MGYLLFTTQHPSKDPGRAGLCPCLSAPQIHIGISSHPSSAARAPRHPPTTLLVPHPHPPLLHIRVQLPPPLPAPSRAVGHPLPPIMSDNQSEQTREKIEAFEAAEAKKKTDEKKRDLKYDSHRGEPGAASYDGKKHIDTPSEGHVWGFTPSKHGATAEEKKKERQADHRARSHHSNTNTVEIPGFTKPAPK